MNSPKQAVDTFIKDHPRVLNHTIVLSDKAEANGGYFIAAQLPNHKYVRKYLVFYTYIKHGKWTVLNMSQAPISVGKPGGPIIKGYTVNSPTNLAIVSTRVDSNISAVIGRQQNKVPFSFVQIGNLPLWAYKFPGSNVNVDMSRNGIVAYDKSGKIIYPAS